jgi:hypothetical protein
MNGSISLALDVRLCKNNRYGKISLLLSFFYSCFKYSILLFSVSQNVVVELLKTNARMWTVISKCQQTELLETKARMLNSMPNTFMIFTLRQV